MLVNAGSGASAVTAGVEGIQKQRRKNNRLQKRKQIKLLAIPKPALGSEAAGHAEGVG